VERFVENHLVMVEFPIFALNVPLSHLHGYKNEQKIINTHKKHPTLGYIAPDVWQMFFCLNLKTPPKIALALRIFSWLSKSRLHLFAKNVSNFVIVKAAFSQKHQWRKGIALGFNYNKKEVHFETSALF